MAVTRSKGVDPIEVVRVERGVDAAEGLLELGVAAEKVVDRPVAFARRRLAAIAERPPSSQWTRIGRSFGRTAAG
ncbi:hypothetical protein ABG088_02800 [Hydrogenibacillus schlegelii]